jgi:hypothetical protein
MTSPWNSFELAPTDSANRASQIAAVSRVPNSMELWWIGSNESVQAAYWYEGGNWTRYELVGAGSAVAGGITAVSRIQTSMELWWTGKDGSVQGAFWYEGGNWGRYQLAPPGSAKPGSAIKAVSRVANSMELWWVGPNGSVQAAYWCVFRRFVTGYFGRT